MRGKYGSLIVMQWFIPIREHAILYTNAELAELGLDKLIALTGSLKQISR